MLASNFDLMAVAEGSAEKRKTSPPLSEGRGQALSKDRLSAFESGTPASGNNAPQASVPQPTRLSSGGLVRPEALRVSETPTEDKPPDVKASDEVEDGLKDSPRLSENMFKRMDSFKGGGEQQDRASKGTTDTPSPSRLSRDLSSKFEAQADASTLQIKPANNAPALRTSMGDNMFVRADSEKKSALVPPWEKTASPVGAATASSPTAYDKELEDGSGTSTRQTHEAEPTESAEPTQPQTPPQLDQEKEGSAEVSQPADGAQIKVDVLGEDTPRKGKGCCALM
jgi:hypothetical protein